ncbi:MAG: ATP-binding protein [Myxococcota bacterium]
MSYERNPVLHAHLDDVDRDALFDHVGARVRCLDADRERWAVRLGLLGRTGSRLAPTPVGLLCFGRRPQLVAPAWGVSAVHICGRNIADEIASVAQLEGDVGALIEGACDFVRRHALGGGGTPEGTPRAADAPPGASPEADLGARTPREYAEEAVREAITNALVHRDLRKPGRVGLHLYDDRLEVWSPGGVPEALGDLDEALARGGVSMPRNPVLCSVAQARGWMRLLGRGLATITRAARDQNRIEVRVTPRGVGVTFPSRFPVASPDRQ